MKLNCLQAQFQDFLLTGASAITQQVKGTENVPAATRLAIYRNAYTSRLTDSLASNFPCLQHYLGESFGELAAAYIDHYPSQCHSIRWFGKHLADFLEKESVFSSIKELADFEWHLTLAFDAADSLPLTVKELATIPSERWGSLCFVPHPSVFRLNYFSNAIPLWQALAYAQNPPPLEWFPLRTSWVLWRTPESQVQFYSMSPEEAGAFDCMRQQQNFAALCEKLCQWVPSEKVSLTAATYLKNWIHKGMLSSYQ